MKTKFWTAYVMLISTALLAQQDTNSTPATPAETPAAPPAVSAPAAMTNEAPPAASEPASTPAAEPEKKKTPHKKKHAVPVSETRTVPLVPGAAVVAVSPSSHVNVRGKAGLKGEILTRLTNGEPVTVVEETRLKKSDTNEPAVWAKVVLPAKAHAWIKASYVDDTTKAIKAKTKNLQVRGGPSENYSVLGTLQGGDPVTEITIKKGWMEIETPANAVAFIAAQYLTQDPVAMAAAAGLSSPTNTDMVAEGQNAVDAGTNTPDMTAAMAAGTNVDNMATNTMTEPPPPRVVEREGFVVGAKSIQAPTEYQLISADNHVIIDYLYTKSNELDLSRYKGMHVIVTGVEGMDERWKSTPLITIERIQVIE